MAAARDDAQAKHWDAAVSNAILSGIHLADAVSLHYTGRRGASGRHEDAADRLESMPELDAGLRRRLAGHLRALLEVKNLVQYSGDEATASDASAALGHVEQAIEATRPVASAAGWRAPSEAATDR